MSILQVALVQNSGFFLTQAVSFCFTPFFLFPTTTNSLWAFCGPLLAHGVLAILSPDVMTPFSSRFDDLPRFPFFQSNNYLQKE